MQLERGTFFFLWGTSVVTHFFFHKVQQIPFLPDKGTVHQLWLIRGWLEATGASIHKGPGSPLAPGKTGLGPSAAPCGFLNTLHFSSVQSSLLVAKSRTRLNWTELKHSQCAHFPMIHPVCLLLATPGSGGLSSVCLCPGPLVCSFLPSPPTPIVNTWL